MDGMEVKHHARDVRMKLALVSIADAAADPVFFKTSEQSINQSITMSCVNPKRWNVSLTLKRVFRKL